VIIKPFHRTFVLLLLAVLLLANACRQDKLPAKATKEYNEVVRIGSRIATRMADGADLGAYGDDLVRQQARKRVGVVVEPEKVASWDHRKMTGSG